MKTEKYPAGNCLHDFTHERNFSFTVWKSCNVSNSAGLTLKESFIRAEPSVFVICLHNKSVLMNAAVTINPFTRHRFEPLLRVSLVITAVLLSFYIRYHPMIKIEHFPSFYNTGKWVSCISLKELSLGVWNGNTKIFQGFGKFLGRWIMSQFKIRVI